jgi:type VI secretion system protein ImpK
MKLPELVMPLFLFAVSLRRKIRRDLPIAYEDVKREVLALFNQIEAQAATKGVTDRWNRAKVVLVYLLDEIASLEAWSGRDQWNNQCLEVEYLGHTERMRGEWFYTEEYDHAMETGDLELIEIVYLCMCLGFEGRYRDQAAPLQNHIDNLFSRLPLLYHDPQRDDKMFPDAYKVDLTAHDPRAPIRIVTVSAVFAGIIVFYFVVTKMMYSAFVYDLRTIYLEL